MGGVNIRSTPQPDPIATAEAQKSLNKETAITQAQMNMIDQYTPDGSLVYAQSGMWNETTPRYVANTNLTPLGQEKLNLQNAIELGLGRFGAAQVGRVSDLLSTPTDYGQAAISKIVAGMPQGPTAREVATNWTDPLAPNANWTSPTDLKPIYTDADASKSWYRPDPTLVGRQDIASNRDVERTLIDLGRRRLDPQLAQSREALEADLANKGLKAGSTGYEREMIRQDQRENDAHNQLVLTGQGQAFDQAATRATTSFGQDVTRNGQFFDQGATRAKLDESRDRYTMDANAQNFAMDAQSLDYGMRANQQNFGQEMTRATYGRDTNQANFGQALAANGQFYDQVRGAQSAALTQRQQALDEISQQRSAPLNEIIGLLSGTQIRDPKFVSTPNTPVQPVDYTGLVSSLYNSSVQQNNGINQANATAQAGMMSGIGSIFGSLGGMFRSDERLKEDITPLGKDPETGDTIAAYRYKPEAGMGGLVHLGLMAQDVEKRDPGAVAELPDGTKAVDYARAVSGAGGRRPGGLAALGAQHRQAA